MWYYVCVCTFSSINLAQKRACALWYGSSGSKGLSFHVSSMYSRITSDSGSGLWLWRNTGTFLWTGLDWRSKGLLFAKFSCKYSYSTPFILKAHSTLAQGKLWGVAISFTVPSILLPNLQHPSLQSHATNYANIFKRPNKWKLVQIY